jgi:hypothetical protein
MPAENPFPDFVRMLVPPEKNALENSGGFPIRSKRKLMTFL